MGNSTIRDYHSYDSICLKNKDKFETKNMFISIDACN